jgi:hypothetical protein
MKGADALRANDSEQCDMDALLPQSDLDRLYNNFWARYKIDFATDADPSDGLVSRRFKEISRRLLTVPNPLKAKTLAQQLPSTKKKSCIPGTSWTIEEKVEEVVMSETLANYLAGLKVELIALAKAGADPRSSAPTIDIVLK